MYSLLLDPSLILTKRAYFKMESLNGGPRKSYNSLRNKQRAQMSFFIVIMFFAIFGLIVFTEIFLIDEKGHGAGVIVRHGTLIYKQNQPRIKMNDYDEIVRNDDYMFKLDNIGKMLMPHNSLPIVEDSIKEFDQAKNIVENQLPPFPGHILPQEGAWQSVARTRYKFFVFSAYYENRKKQHLVRIIGATKTRGPDHVWCRLWYLDSNGTNNYFSKTVPASIKIIRENWNLNYSAVFVICQNPTNYKPPKFLSVVSFFNDEPSNLIKVTNQDQKKIPNKFGVCVKPIHFSYNRALEILEFIEFNRILGVEHFTFYNHTIGPQVNCILQDYINKGIVSILPWNLDLTSQKEIRTEGLFAALNDCLYRSMYRFSHVLFIDFDEFIVPKQSESLPQMIKVLNAKKPPNRNLQTAAYSFQNAFFYLQFDDDKTSYKTSDVIESNLITLKKTRRKAKLLPHKQRSKYICRPELIVEAGNHFIWEYIPGHRTLNVPSDTALLHHYRVCEFGGDDCIKAPHVKDTTTFKFRDKLSSRVRSQFNYFKPKCKLEELEFPKHKFLQGLLDILKPNIDRKR